MKEERKREMNQNRSATKNDPRSFGGIAGDCVSPFIVTVKNNKTQQTHGEFGNLTNFKAEIQRVTFSLRAH